MFQRVDFFVVVVACMRVRASLDEGRPKFRAGNLLSRRKTSFRARGVRHIWKALRWQAPWQYCVNLSSSAQFWSSLCSVDDFMCFVGGVRREILKQSCCVHQKRHQHIYLRIRMLNPLMDAHVRGDTTWTACDAVSRVLPIFPKIQYMYLEFGRS
jgi:hypothetical protein